MEYTNENEKETAVTETSTDEEIAGKKDSQTGFILGIVSLVSVLFLGGLAGAVVAIIAGIIGMNFAKKAKEAGFSDTKRTLGFVFSLIGLIVGCIIFVILLIALVAALLNLTLVESSILPSLFS